ncbi:hypothetical protein C0431_10655 [bacterium]|nr:hypothetical protein [bacterium]
MKKVYWSAVVVVMIAGCGGSGGSNSSANALPENVILFSDFDGTGTLFAIDSDGQDRTSVLDFGAANVSISPSRTSIVYEINDPTATNNRRRIYLASNDGTGIRKVSVEDGIDDSQASFSPSGNRIFVARGLDDLNNRKIVSMDLDGSDVVQHTFPGAGLPNDLPNFFSPSQHPSSNRILYARTEQTSGQTVVATSDFSGENEQVLTPAGCSDPVWSPDGTKIAYSDAITTNYKVVVMNANGTGKVTILNGPNRYSGLTWSPDGAKLAFSVVPIAPNSRNEIFVVNADGSGLAQITTGSPVGAFRPRWSSY